MRNIKIILQTARRAGIVVAVLGCLMGAIYSIIVSGAVQQILMDMLWLGSIGLGLGFVTGVLVCMYFTYKKDDFYDMAALLAMFFGAIELGFVLWWWG